MTLKSMTGYGAATHVAGAWSVEIELRSVNQRNREIRVLSSPRELAWEHELTRLVQAVVERGKVDARIRVTRSRTSGDGDLAALHRLRGRRWRLRVTLGAAPAPPGAEFHEGEDTPTLPAGELALATQAALAALDADRSREGAALGEIIMRHVAEMAGLAARLRALRLSERIARESELRARLDELTALRGGGAEDRLREEAAYLLMRSDIAEELDRIDTHLQAVSDLIRSGGAVGKRLDVLAQELGREAHTTSAKVSGAEAKGLAIELRNVVERLREQVQNIE
jgi:uncharacterized protein YicC (UPF0701 family)